MTFSEVATSVIRSLGPLTVTHQVDNFLRTSHLNQSRLARCQLMTIPISIPDALLAPMMEEAPRNCACVRNEDVFRIGISAWNPSLSPYPCLRRLRDRLMHAYALLLSLATHAILLLSFHSRWDLSRSLSGPKFPTGALPSDDQKHDADGHTNHVQGKAVAAIRDQ